MSEELSTPTPAEEPIIEAPEVEPDVDPALLELVKSLDPETLKNVKNLDEFYKRVNRTSMEVAAQKKELEAKLSTAPSPTAADDDDDEPELDEHAQKVLRAFLQRELAPVFSSMVEEKKEASERIWEDFTSAHSDVPADKIAEQFYELGFDKTATTPAKYEAALKKAYKAAKADTLDVDALVEQKLQERLSAIKDKGDEVVEVKEKKSVIEPAPKSEGDIINDPDIPWFKKMEFLNR